MGGTGISSSELSPIENFHAAGCAGAFSVCEEPSGAPLLRFGLEG